jgi:hypothetical protein
MKKRQYIKLVHEGKFVAEVDIELLVTDEGWSPYLSLDDAEELDYVRDALRRGDLAAPSRRARVFTLTPVAIWKRSEVPDILESKSHCFY